MKYKLAYVKTVGEVVMDSKSGIILSTAEVTGLLNSLEQRLAEAEAKLPRWIPVSEGLPPPIGRSPSVYGSEWVIASYRWNGAVFIGECRFVHGPKQAWKTSNDDYDIEVTHWMPLPEPPESGKGE